MREQAIDAITYVQLGGACSHIQPQAVLRIAVEHYAGGRLFGSRPRDPGPGTAAEDVKAGASTMLQSGPGGEAGERGHCV
jgi:hypothetical protein